MSRAFRLVGAAIMLGSSLLSVAEARAITLSDGGRRIVDDRIYTRFAATPHLADLLQKSAATDVPPR
jgi:hypothetical protein